MSKRSDDLAASTMPHRGIERSRLGLLETRSVACVLLAMLTLIALQIARSRFPSATSIESVSTHALVDVNTASEAELVHLPGIGPALAARILEDRQRKGPFRNAEDLQRVPGIGPKIAARILPYLSFMPQDSGATRLAGRTDELSSVSIPD